MSCATRSRAWLTNLDLSIFSVFTRLMSWAHVWIPLWFQIDPCISIRHVFATASAQARDDDNGNNRMLYSSRFRTCWDESTWQYTIHTRRPANQIGTEPSTLSFLFFFLFLFFNLSKLFDISLVMWSPSTLCTIASLSIPSLFLYSILYQPSFTRKGTIRHFRHRAPIAPTFHRSLERSIQTSKIGVLFAVVNKRGCARSSRAWFGHLASVRWRVHRPQEHWNMNTSWRCGVLVLDRSIPWSM